MNDDSRRREKKHEYPTLKCHLVYVNENITHLSFSVPKIDAKYSAIASEIEYKLFDVL